MDWIRFDIAWLTHPKFKRVRRAIGFEGIGMLLHVFGFIVQHGARPGIAEYADGRPFSDEDIADGADITMNKWAELKEACIKSCLFTTREDGAIEIGILVDAGVKYSEEMARRKERQEGAAKRQADKRKRDKAHRHA